MRFALFVLVALASAASAQPALSTAPADRPVALASDSSRAPSDEDAVRAAVAALFDGMRAHDSSAVGAVLHPDLRLLSAVETPDGVQLQPASRADFLRVVATAPVSLDERIDGLEVRIDGPLATAWMRYRFYADGRFSHCGVNAVQLARLDGRWQMIHLMDTRRRDCGAEE